MPRVDLSVSLQKEVVHGVLSSLLCPLVPSFRAISGRLKLTVRRPMKSSIKILSWVEGVSTSSCALMPGPSLSSSSLLISNLRCAFQGFRVQIKGSQGGWELRKGEGGGEGAGGGCQNLPDL